ncbi:hypothetical protein LCGC14_1797420 [marine sediment metagenome]|uniref:Uncharacterized protein n=1 Tax=marine sediment metagenome TaxID=412755 RepID=A0A0F9J5E7_9ZZZZ
MSKSDRRERLRRDGQAFGCAMDAVIALRGPVTKERRAEPMKQE